VAGFAVDSTAKVAGLAVGGTTKVAGLAVGGTTKVAGSLHSHARQPLRVSGQHENIGQHENSGQHENITQSSSAKPADNVTRSVLGPVGSRPKDAAAYMPQCNHGAHSINPWNACSWHAGGGAGD
jgi:hypothetical protein